MTLNNILSGQKSSTNDLDQIVKALNGTDTSTAVLVSNRISAGAVGATAGQAAGNAGASLIGGVFTAADPQQGERFFPSVQGVGYAKAASPSSSGTSYQTGDVAADNAGCFWIATGNTSGGLTPFVSVGKGRDNMRVRSTPYQGSIGSPGGGGASLSIIQDWRGWDWGFVQWDNINGYLIPSTGFYQLTMTLKATNMPTNGWLRSGWQICIPTNLFQRPELTRGDRTFGDSGPTGDVGSVAEDIRLFTAGTLITPYASFNNPAATNALLGTAFNDPTPDDFTMYAIVEFLGANPST